MTDIAWLDMLLSVLGLALHLGVLLFVLAWERRQPQATMAWLLAIAMLPFVGIALYLLIGVTRSRRAVDQHHDASEHVGRVVRRLSVLAKLGEAGEDTLDRRSTSLLRLSRGLASTPPSLGNLARLLLDGRATYDAMRHAIEAARDHVHVEFYIIQPDETGRALRDTLVAAAERGVQVRVVADALGSHALPDAFWDPLRAVGGQAAWFRPVWRWARLARLLNRRDRLDFRNHRKIVVVDGRVGFTGGINVGREYLGLDPERGAWRDTHVQLDGPAVLSLQKTFAEDWFTATGELLEDERQFPEPVTPGDSSVAVVDSGPDRRFAPIERLIVHSLALASERVWLTSPYFVPSGNVLDALISAAVRGVDVRLLVPARGDHLLVTLAGRSDFETLLDAGVRIFEYERGFVHCKTLVVDSWLGSCGSANMDMRSFHLNFELNAFVLDARFADELAGHFTTDLEGAREVQLDDVRAAPLWRRVAWGLARLVSPLL
jgi:cardiolipin synthase